jgi:hypothetical protein
MTYRERRIARAERLRGWAEKREEKAEALTAQDEHYRGDHAFNTQPGHIPERARVIARSKRAFEHGKKARYMAGRAASIEAAAERAIYSDDPDACEQLEARIAELEAERARVKRYNASARKGEPDGSLLSDREREVLMSMGRAGQVREALTFPPYHLANLGGNINRQKKRLQQLRGPRQPRSVTARRDGDCPRCDFPIRAGVVTITEVEPGVWVHAGCAVSA